MRRMMAGYIMIGLIVVAASLVGAKAAQAIWRRLAAVGFEAVGDHACTDGITFRLAGLDANTYTANHVVITSTTTLTPTQIADTALSPIPANPILVNLDDPDTFIEYGYSGYYTVPWSTAQISGTVVQLDFQDPQTSKPEVSVVDCVVADLPAITGEPAGWVIDAGQTVTLTVQASGAGTLSYQWYQGITGDITTPVGANSAEFTTPALSSDTNYWVRVSNDLGYVDSRTAAALIASAHTYVPLVKK
jgi:hypothetical protein